MSPVPIRLASYLFAAVFLLAAILLHLVPALFAGMIVYALVTRLMPLTEKAVHAKKAALLASVLVATVIVAAVTGSAVLLYAFLKNGGASGLPQLWSKLAEIIDGANAILPPWLQESLPESADQLRELVVGWLNEHRGEIQGLGKAAGVTLVHILIGGILGAMVAVSASCEALASRPLTLALQARSRAFYLAFERVFIGQAKISLINTLFTGLYLALVLPLAGIHLPFIKTILAITLIVGLLPVIGNLISNFVIIVVSASVSFNAALAALIFLVVLHKAEYFLSARIIGHQISAKAWEMLMAMLIMEAAFGIPGMAVAPVFYAYLKAELRAAELI